MKHEITELVFILDASGSMSGLEKDTIGGFNSLINKNKKENEKTIVSTVFFNDKVHIIHDRIDINLIEKLTDKDYIPAGCTAMLDAIGSSIMHIKQMHNNLNEDVKPTKTLFIITTDGLENASREYSYTKIKNLIEKQKELGWEFLFLGANIDAIGEAEKFGIEKDKVANYKCTSKGIDVNFEALDAAICQFKEKGKIKKSWKNSIDENYLIDK